jgi:hypothetical protein
MDCGLWDMYVVVQNSCNNDRVLLYVKARGGLTKMNESCGEILWIPVNGKGRIMAYHRRKLACSSFCTPKVRQITEIVKSVRRLRSVNTRVEGWNRAKSGGICIMRESGDTDTENGCKCER